MSGSKILTRDGYEAAIDRFYHEAKQAAMARRSTISKSNFKAMALQRFDESSPVYGPLDLTARCWPQEAQEESVDDLAYTIFELVKKERGL